MTEDNLIGKQLDEYRLEAMLGHGGMARVYRGLDVRLKRYAAIKVIDAPYQTDPDYASRFEREAQAVAQLDHPHIVRLYRYGETEGLLYMAMQYIQGANLGDVLTSYRADKEFIEPADAQRIIREVCLALDYAHSHGVIHRDVKPANIILDQQGRAILTDFGLALLIDFGTHGEIFGSPHYIAPEQAISSAAAVPQSDLYSIGIILYEMFTGQVPFEANLPLDIARMHLTDSPRPPRELRPAISPELEAVILKALAKEPEGRYPDGAALADALDQALPAKPMTSSVPGRTIPQRVAVEQARYSLPLPLVTKETSAPQVNTPHLEPAPNPSAATEPVRHSGQISQIERTLRLDKVPPARRKLYRIFAGIIVLSGLLSCIGLAVLASSGKISFATATSTAAFRPIASNATTPSANSVSPSSTPFVPPTFTPSPSPVASKTPTLAPTTAPAPTDTPVPPPLVYNLLVATHNEDSLFIVNQSASEFPLGPLRVGDGKGAINGTDWGIDVLANGACVTVWKKSGKPQQPDGIKCTQVRAHLT